MHLAGLQRTFLPFRAVNIPGRPGHSPGLQRHHLLPRQLLVANSLSRMIGALGAERIGFHDFRRNGLLLPATEQTALRIGMPLHRGPHRNYNELVGERAGQIEKAWHQARKFGCHAADRDALMRLDLLQKALRRRLLDPRRWTSAPLNRRDPALDFSHLDRMAEMLWGATQPEN